MHARVVPVLLRLAGLDALAGDAQPQPPDRHLGEVVRAVVGADGGRQAAFAEQLPEGLEGVGFLGRFQGFAQRQEARGLGGDGEGVTVLAVAELELALEIGAPQRIGGRGPRQGRAAGLVAAPPAGALD